ncbi:uncharacterized protein J3D65DRAFT_357951 [Phyllosticta citribraziliensis]|uniref:Uncharacterized protein n=1 Tax=Phyllosticta citribraziliensis TaxID=989973 RepID=A0ABR1LP09_9PEZI
MSCVHEASLARSGRQASRSTALRNTRFAHFCCPDKSQRHREHAHGRPREEWRGRKRGGSEYRMGKPAIRENLCHGVGQLHLAARISPRPQKVGPGVGARLSVRTSASSTRFRPFFSWNFLPCTSKVHSKGVWRRNCWPSISSTLRSLGAPISAFATLPDRAWPVGVSRSLRWRHGRVRFSNRGIGSCRAGSCVSAPVQIPGMFNIPPHDWQATTAPHGTLAPIAHPKVCEKARSSLALPRHWRRCGALASAQIQC